MNPIRELSEEGTRGKPTYLATLCWSITQTCTHVAVGLAAAGESNTEEEYSAIYANKATRRSYAKQNRSDKRHLQSRCSESLMRITISLSGALSKTSDDGGDPSYAKRSLIN